jgi:hypothetical protein
MLTAAQIVGRFTGKSISVAQQADGAHLVRIS